MIKSLDKYFKSFTRGSSSEMNTLKNIEALINLDSLIDIYIPWSGSALKPSAIKLILNDILIHNRKNIVECGSGISTLFVAGLFKQHNIQDSLIYTIDHDKDWFEVVNKYLTELDLKKYVKTIHAPLTSFDSQFGQILWYDTKVLNDELGELKIDQIIVDGPPAYQKEHRYSRFPAAVYLKKFLNNDFCLFLDDANRSGERQIIEEWSKILNLEFQFKYGDNSLAIGIKNKKFNI